MDSASGTISSNGGNYAVSYAANTTSSINKAALTVTADSLTRAFDGQAFSGGNGVGYRWRRT